MPDTIPVNYTTNVDTQNFFNEVMTPSIITANQMRNAVRAFLTPIGNEIQQIEKFSQLLELMRVSESDDNLFQLTEESNQKTNAFRRQCEEVKRQLYNLIQTQREHKEHFARMKQRAKDLGYVIADVTP